jgi:hypothetical protein
MSTQKVLLNSILEKSVEFGFDEKAWMKRMKRPDPGKHCLVI